MDAVEASQEAPLPNDTGYAQLWNAIIQFHDCQTALDQQNRQTTQQISTATPSLSSLEALRVRPKGSWPSTNQPSPSGLTIKREHEENSNIVRPFVLRKKSSDDGS